MLFISFLLIGCAWAAMLALPFTILTNALSGGHMGTYLGLFNGTICIPQIIAAALGGTILALFTPQGGLPPEINMLVLAFTSSKRTKEKKASKHTPPKHNTQRTETGTPYKGQPLSL